MDWFTDRRKYECTMVGAIHTCVRFAALCMFLRVSATKKFATACVIVICAVRAVEQVWGEKGVSACGGVWACERELRAVCTRRVWVWAYRNQCGCGRTGTSVGVGVQEPVWVWTNQYGCGQTSVGDTYAHRAAVEAARGW
eukprot:4509-Chlamydomonas_euryale.AAC.5